MIIRYLDPYSVKPGLAYEVEIKRRYDFAMRTEGKQLIPPARQFWGSCR